MTAEDVTLETAPRRKPPSWVLPTALVPMIAVLVCGWVAGSVWANWQVHHPLGLIALSPINRFLLLTTNRLDFWSYFSVGLGRHLFPDPFFYLLGYWYGGRALKWVSEGNAFATRLVGDDGHGLLGLVGGVAVFRRGVGVPRGALGVGVRSVRFVRVY